LAQIARLLWNISMESMDISMLKPSVYLVSATHDVLSVELVMY
jgi:hypothetical protein